MPRKKPAKGTVKVNFKGVESRRTPPEGDYKCRVLEATSGVSSNKNDQIEVVAEIASGEYKGQKLYLNFALVEQALWKLHAFLTALGMDVPEDELDIDLSDLVDEEFLGVVTHETYNGKKRAKLTDFDSLDNYKGDDDEDEDDEDEKPKSKKSAPAKKTKGKKKPADDEDDEDEDDDEDEEEDEKPSKKSSKKAPAKKGKKKPVDDDDDEDDDEEDEKPAKKGKKAPAKKSKKKTYDRDDVEDMDEDELQELLEEAGLEDEVDLDDYKKLPKKVAAVIEALEEADLLDD
jgi:hypothetical protein